MVIEITLDQHTPSPNSPRDDSEEATSALPSQVTVHLAVCTRLGHWSDVEHDLDLELETWYCTRDPEWSASSFRLAVPRLGALAA